MSRKRQEPVTFVHGGSAKRARTTMGSMSSRVVIEDLTKRNKRRKVPVGRRYIPGSIKPGPMLPVRHHIQHDPGATQTSANILFRSDSESVLPDDFTNIVFEDSLPPQRNRQVNNLRG